jgi:hypothetical protein
MCIVYKAIHMCAFTYINALWGGVDTWYILCHKTLAYRLYTCHILILLSKLSLLVKVELLRCCKLIYIPFNIFLMTGCYFFEIGGFFRVFFIVLYSALSHMPPLRIPLFRRMLGLNPGLTRLCHWQSGALTIRLDLILNLARSPYCRRYDTFTSTYS